MTDFLAGLTAKRKSGIQTNDLLEDVIETLYQYCTANDAAIAALQAAIVTINSTLTTIEEEIAVLQGE